MNRTAVARTALCADVVGVGKPARANRGRDDGRSSSWCAASRHELSFFHLLFHVLPTPSSRKWFMNDHALVASGRRPVRNEFRLGPGGWWMVDDGKWKVDGQRWVAGGGVARVKERVEWAGHDEDGDGREGKREGGGIRGRGRVILAQAHRRASRLRSGALLPMPRAASGEGTEQNDGGAGGSAALGRVRAVVCMCAGGTTRHKSCTARRRA